MRSIPPLFILAILISCITFSRASYSKIPFLNQSPNIKIMSLNVAQLPWPLGIKDRSKRMNEVTKLLKNMAEKPDIVCFQEAFTSTVRSIVKKNLKDVYPYIYPDTRIGRKLFGVNSGLMILSKYPIEKKLLYTYKNHLGDGNFTRKGVMGIKVNLNDGLPLYVFTTHMQAGRSDIFILFDIFKKRDTDYYSLLQLYEASAVIKKFIDASDKVTMERNGKRFFIKYKSFTSAIYTGDFNIAFGKDHELYDNMMTIFQNPIDTFDFDTSPVSSTTWEKVHNNVPNHRIDYMLSLNPESPLVGKSAASRHFPESVTDHLAIIGNFVLVE